MPSANALLAYPPAPVRVLPVPGSRRWVIPDIHGCARSLVRLLDRIGPAKDDQLFFLGDYVNKGPDSSGVIDFIMQLERDGYQVYALRGNHDDALLRLSETPLADTEDGFKDAPDLLGPDGRLQPPYRDWLAALPLAFDLGDFYLVHAGLDFSLAAPFADPEGMMTLRTSVFTRDQLQGRRMIHGHDPRPLEEIKSSLTQASVIHPLDNGCVYYGERAGMGHLLALNLDSMLLLEQPNAEPSFAWKVYIPEMKALPPHTDPDPNSAEGLIEQLEGIRSSADRLLHRYYQEIMSASDPYRVSASNLITYLALRQYDLREIQNSLGEMGVSRLGRAEAYTLAMLVMVANNLRRMAGLPVEKMPKEAISFSQGTALLRQHALDLLGPQDKERVVRIMVTLDTHAAYDYDFVKALVSSGINCVRINCAHDDEGVWGKMIANVRRASEETGVPCKVAMDLGGPKLRTGHLAPGPQVQRMKATKNANGEPEQPFRVWMGPAADSGLHRAKVIDISAEDVALLKKGDRLRFKDLRGKKREMEVKEAEGAGFWVEGWQTAYLRPGLAAKVVHKSKVVAEVIVTSVPVNEQSILLQTGDTLILHAEEHPGEGARLDEVTGELYPAHIACPVPELYQQVKIGERVLLDDGEIEGLIEGIAPGELRLRITYARPGGSKLRADKGINLPGSDLHLQGLTDKDREDLPFIIQHADILNASFVNAPEDVHALYAALEEEGAPDNLGVILKIETVQGFMNLPGILLAGMQRYPIGVMIARGDLAVEAGWNLLAEVQEEILRVCESAHVPIVWATQVLEGMAKTGRPSRAEITDAAMGQRAECVMLNKGPFILQTVHMLNDILSSMQNFRQKKAPMLPVLKGLRMF